MKYQASIVVATLLVFAGCSTDDDIKKAPRLCPQTAIVHELEQIQDFGKDLVEPQNLVAQAIMRKVDGTCEYKDDGVDVSFELSMSAEKGPRLGGNQFGFPYFVSIVTPDRKIVSKEQMTATFKFSDSQNTSSADDRLHIFLPLAKGGDAGNHQILMGFQLTEEQIESMRKMNDLRIDKVLGTTR